MSEVFGEKAKYKPPSSKDIPKWIENAMIFCTIWQIGAVTDANGRKMFSDMLRSFLSGDMISSNDEKWQLFLAKTPSYVPVVLEDGSPRSCADAIPDNGLVYDYRVDMTKCKWVNWLSGAAAENLIDPLSFNDILVPTIDTIRNEWIMLAVLHNGRHMMVTGETGTGKSVATQQILKSRMDPSKYKPIFLSFSAQTTENMTQDIIDGKLGKRRKGYFGPPPGLRCIVFVDDLNMPKKEEYGAQPPVELLRTWMDHGGWYDRKDPQWAFRNIVDLQFVAAMGPPGGGRSQITQRYNRHFNMVNYVPFDPDSLKRIFSVITDWFLEDFGGAIRKIGSQCVDASISLYNSVMVSLLPTPLKSHYTFNLRDLSKIFQGLAQAHPDKVASGDDFLRMWGHECTRVVDDRLVNAEDHSKFKDILHDTCKTFFKKEWVSLLKDGMPPMFGNFMDNRIEPEKRIYEEVKDFDKLKEVCNEYLEDFNAMTSKPMNLVLFMNAIDHLWTNCAHHSVAVW